MTNQESLSLKDYNRWVAFLNIFRAIHPRIETQAIHAFLYVAQHEGKTQREIADAVGTTQASISRNLALLSDYTNSPMHLLTMRESPTDRRQKEYALTTRGRMVLQQLRAL
jgi:DNA-binding MarR family transcriptional regulator